MTQGRGPSGIDPYNRSIHSSSRRHKAVRRRRLMAGAAGLLAIIVVLVIVLASGGGGQSSRTPGSSSKNAKGSTTATTTGQQTVNMNVHAVDGTRPSDFQMVTKIFQGTRQIPSYTRTSPINLGPGQDYTSLKGVVTFRGNNYRDDPAYGTANVTQGKLTVLWTVPTGSMKKSSGGAPWSGSGWTGQPLIVQWPDDLKRIMNINPTAKAESGLTEIIYPCEDGNIYFLNLRDGAKTRPTIVTGGGALKGTASIDPSGIPILFDGQGDNSPGKQVMRSRIYSLIDQHLLYSFGTQPDPNSYRKWNAYDSSALYDSNADTIIEPGENGILYTVKLNTKFDKAAGTLTVNPDLPVKANYTDPAYADESVSHKVDPTHRWYGMEDSAVIWHNYCYIADNGGSLMCWDLNTMKLVWVQNCQDDTNTSPVFEEDPATGTCYIYISTSSHLSITNGKAEIPVWKINAATGEIVWKSTPYSCLRAASDVSGGMQDTPVLGKNDISNLVIYAVACTPKVNQGLIVALDKTTGKEVWRTPIPNYSWSSPVAIYTPSGKSYIVTCDSVGMMRLLEGTTGKVVSTLKLNGNVEASPAVFNDMIVVGTRSQKIYGIKIS